MKKNKGANNCKDTVFQETENNAIAPQCKEENDEAQLKNYQEFVNVLLYPDDQSFGVE